MREVVSPVWAFEGPGATARSVHLISNEGGVLGRMVA